MRTVVREPLWFASRSKLETCSRLRDRNAAENAAVLRHIALGLLQNGKSTKLGTKNKRLKAGWNENYLAKLLFEQRG